PQIKDRLRASADRQDRRARQFGKISGDVHSTLGTAMDAANATGGKEANSSQLCAGQRAGNSGCAQTMLGEYDGQIAPTDLGHFLCVSMPQSLDLGRAKTNDDLPVYEADGGWNYAFAANGFFHCARGLDVGGIGEAMSDDGGFECDNGSPVIEGDAHLFG